MRIVINCARSCILNGLGGNESLDNGSDDALVGRRFRPPGEPVSYSPGRLAADRRSRRYMLKAANWYEEHPWGKLSVPQNFIALTLVAGAIPVTDIFIDTRLSKLTLYEALGHMDSLM